jgi:short-subunit dehydrogenase
MFSADWFMTFIIVGASAGLGRSLAEKFASKNYDLVLISSDIRDLDPLKMDLENRFHVKIFPIEMSLTKNHLDFNEIESALKKSSPLEGLLFPIGYPYEKDLPGLNEGKTIDIVNANFLSILIFINQFLDVLKERKSLIIGFGSVASIRGRSRNAIYSASKRGLESYFESLRHFTQNSKICVQFYNLGYLNTNLAFNDEKTIFFKRADVKPLADIVFTNLFKDFGIKYYPKSWKLVKIILPLLPWNFFKKMKI